MSTPTIDAHGIRNIDFNKLWMGESISLIGSQVTLLAIPITAAITLGATPMQRGVLSALGSLPALLFGLPAGAWVDRNKRRPILIGADIGRALILAIVPLSAVLGMLKMEVLYGAAFLIGALGLFFNVAYRSYRPGLVGKEQLVKGNSRLELSNSIAEILGPGAAGGLIQLVGAPIAIAVDAFSFIISAFSIGWIRKPEIVVKSVERDTNLWIEIKAGLRLVFGEPRLRALAGCLSTLNLFNSIIEAVSILFLTRQVGLSAGGRGGIFVR